MKVVPTGATEPVVIEADLSLASGADYTVVAVGTLENIEPLVLIDDNSLPAAGNAHVRFVHASPDAPAVDIAVKDGPVLFSNIAFKETGDYLPVNAGTYDLKVRLAGTDTVALDVPGVELKNGVVYTVFAMGLAGGEPALQAVPSVDAARQTRVRAVHASPDAPAVDVLVNDNICDGVFINGLDRPLSDVTVAMNFSNGAAITRETLTNGIAFFYGFDVPDEITLTAEMPNEYRGLALEMCPYSSISKTLTAEDFSTLGYTFRDFRFTIAGAVAGR